MSERAPYLCPACETLIVEFEDHHGQCTEALRQIADDGDNEADLRRLFVDDMAKKLDGTDDPHCIMWLALHASAAMSLRPFEAPEIGLSSR